ncbi:hypothetical protein Tco_1304095 [Tanacetum coccineum]
MRTRSQARRRRQPQVRQTSVESSNLEKPDNPPIVTMADNRTMAQLLEAPTEGYEDAIVIPEITANNFEIKHGLLNLVQNKQFFGNDKEDPHAHIRERFTGFRYLTLGDCQILMAEGLSTRMLMEHMDTQGQSMFTSIAWRRLFDIRGSLVHELIMELFSTFRFGEAILDLDTLRALQFQLGGVRSVRRIPDKGDLRDDWIRISSTGDFLGTTPFYTLIRDPMLRLCHRLIAFSIAGRSQAPEKYVARLAEHFGLLAEERLQDLTVIAPALPIIDMAELVRLQLCVELGNTWAWVPIGPARQEEGAGGVAKEASVAPGGGDEDEEMPQAVARPPRTQGESIGPIRGGGA